MRALVFVCPHDRDDSFGDGGVCRVWRMKIEGSVVVVNFEHDLDPFEIKDAEIMLLVGIVGVTKVVEDCDRLDQAFDGWGPNSAMPAVMTAPPPRRCFRSSSLSARVFSASVCMDMVISPVCCV